MISKVKYLAKGKRSKVFTGFYKGKKVCIKIQREDIDVNDSVLREGKWLLVLNRYYIGPKLLFYGKSLIIYEFVSGDLILDYFRKGGKGKILDVVREVLRQCKILDDLGIVKEEMHRPLKHIFVSDKIRMIDFERCHKSIKVKNVTQFCQFLTSGEVLRIFKEKGISVDVKGLRGYLVKSERSVDVEKVMKFIE